MVDYVTSLSNDEACLRFQEEISKPVESRNSLTIGFLHIYLQHFRFLKATTMPNRVHDNACNNGMSLSAKTFVPGGTKLIPVPVIPSSRLVQVYMNVTNLMTGSKSIYDRVLTPNGYVDFTVQLNFDKIFDEIVADWNAVWLESKGYTYSTTLPFNPTSKFRAYHSDIKKFDQADDLLDAGPALISSLLKKVECLEPCSPIKTIGQKLILVTIDGESDDSDALISVIKKYLAINWYVEVWAWKYFCHPFYKELKLLADEIRSSGRQSFPIQGIKSHHIPYFELKFLDDIKCRH